MNYNEINSKTQTEATQAAITPDQAIELLKAGNQRFRENRFIKRSYMTQVEETASGQYPFSTILSCIDSRVPPKIIFDQGIGDMFNARVAGNFINLDILGSIEFACKLAGSKVVVVLGHTSCGAVKGACDHVRMGNLTQMLDKIRPAVDSTPSDANESRDSSNATFVDAVAKKNVELTVESIRRLSPILSEMEEDGDIKIVGAMYDVSDGSVTFY